MKKLTNLCLAVLSLSVLNIETTQAATEGFYAGAGIGASQLETPNKNIVTNNLSPIQKQSHELTGLGGRVFAGFNINPYLGVESGVAQYAKSKYSSQTLLTHTSLDYSLNAIDVVAKVYLPIAESFNLYGLGGVALVHSNVDYNGYTMSKNPKGSESQTKVRPIYGVGANYQIPQSNFVTGFEFSRIQGIGKVNLSEPTKKVIPSANMITFNIAYNFN